MLANTHITPSAISTLTSCAVTRAALMLEALISTINPTAISASTTPSRTPSTWRVK